MVAQTLEDMQRSKELFATWGDQLSDTFYGEVKNLMKNQPREKRIYRIPTHSFLNFILMTNEAIKPGYKELNIVTCPQVDGITDVFSEIIGQRASEKSRTRIIVLNNGQYSPFIPQQENKNFRVTHANAKRPYTQVIGNGLALKIDYKFDEKGNPVEIADGNIRLDFLYDLHRESFYSLWRYLRHPQNETPKPRKISLFNAFGLFGKN